MKNSYVKYFPSHLLFITTYCLLFFAFALIAQSFVLFRSSVPAGNIPHRRVKRSGLIDAEVTSNDGIEKIPIGKPEHNFKIYRKRLNWKEAHQVCETNEGHLASFLTKAEAEDVVDAIFGMSHFSEDYDWGRTQNEFGLDRRYWIGLTDLFQEGKWVWVGKGKSLTYNSMWYPSQPDHIHPNGSVRSGRHQHCGSLWNPAYYKIDKDKKPTEKHSFDDLECDRRLYFICQRDEDKLKKDKEALEGLHSRKSPEVAAPAP